MDTNSSSLVSDGADRIRQSIEKVLVDTVKDRWHLIVSPSNHLVIYLMKNAIVISRDA